MQESLLSKIVVSVVSGVLLIIIGNMITQDSSNVQNVKEVKPETSSTNGNNSRVSSNTVVNQSDKQPYSPSSSESKPNSNVEDYTSYINTSLNKSNVSVTIIDGSGKVQTDVSNEIANIYKRSGKSTSTGLLRSKFIEKPEFQELREGNSSVIDKLKLSSFADYLALGKIQYSMRNGKLVDGTVVCSASLTMTIISTNGGLIEQSFTISNANGNGVTQDQAQEDAFQKLLDKYYNEHSTF